MANMTEKYLMVKKKYSKNSVGGVKKIMGDAINLKNIVSGAKNKWAE